MKKVCLFILTCCLSIFVASIISLSDITRLDIYNKGSNGNRIELLSRAAERKPDWCKSDKGQCTVVEFRNYWFWSRKKFSFKTIGKGNLYIYFLGQHHPIRGGG